MREAEKRVRDLEEEKHKLDDELKTHVERTRRVNIGQEVTFLSPTSAPGLPPAPAHGTDPDLMVTFMGPWTL